MPELRRHSAPQMGRPPKYRHTVANLRKNSAERIAVELIEYNGFDLCHIAVVRDGSGKHNVCGMKGTARYVSVNVRQLSALISALEEARRRAIAEGLLADDSTGGSGMSGKVVQLRMPQPLHGEEAERAEIERCRRRITEWLEANHYFDHHRSRLYALVHGYVTDSQNGGFHRLEAADELLREFDRIRTGKGGLS